MRRFFRKRFRFEGENWPVWGDVLAEQARVDLEEKAGESSTSGEKKVRLDLLVEASGFGREMEAELESVCSASRWCEGSRLIE